MIIAATMAVAQRHQTKQVRTHYHLTTGAITYVVTEIVSTPDESTDRTTFLLQDSNGDRLMLSHVRDYLKQTSTFEITDVVTKEYVRSTITYPYEASTRDATVKEARNRPEILRGWDSPVSVELNGVAAEARPSEWMSSQSRDRRSELRRAASAVFLDRLERSRAAFGRSAPTGLFCAHLLQYLVANETCQTQVIRSYADPDCTFDAAFRYPCSDRQRERIKTVISAGKRVDTY